LPILADVVCLRFADIADLLKEVLDAPAINQGFEVVGFLLCEAVVVEREWGICLRKPFPLKPPWVWEWLEPGRLWADGRAR
jgi:hypothetical protein